MERARSFVMDDRKKHLEQLKDLGRWIASKKSSGEENNEREG